MNTMITIVSTILFLEFIRWVKNKRKKTFVHFEPCPECAYDTSVHILATDYVDEETSLAHLLCPKCGKEWFEEYLIKKGKEWTN